MSWLFVSMPMTVTVFVLWLKGLMLYVGDIWFEIDLDFERFGLRIEICRLLVLVLYVWIDFEQPLCIIVNLWLRFWRDGLVDWNCVFWEIVVLWNWLCVIMCVFAGFGWLFLCIPASLWLLGLYFIVTGLGISVCWRSAKIVAWRAGKQAVNWICLRWRVRLFFF